MIQFGYEESHIETVVEKEGSLFSDRYAPEEKQSERNCDR